MIPKYSNFNDAISVRFLVIMKNVVISFIVGYKWPILRPPSDVITMKKNILTSFGTIFSYLTSYWICVSYFKVFKMASIFRSRQTFLLDVIPEIEYASTIALSISDILLLIDALAELFAVRKCHVFLKFTNELSRDRMYYWVCDVVTKWCGTDAVVSVAFMYSDMCFIGCDGVAGDVFTARSGTRLFPRPLWRSASGI